jgi:hypothetical protein
MLQRFQKTELAWGTTLPTLIIWRKKIPQTLRSNHFLLQTNITKKEQNRDLQFRSIELGSEHHLEPLPRPRRLSALLLFLLFLTLSLSLFGTPRQRLRIPLSKMYFTATTKNKEWTKIYTKNGSSEIARKRLDDIG